MTRILLSLCIAIGVARPAEAATIYAQATPAVPIAAYSSVDVPIIGQKIADNFKLPGSGSVTVHSL